MRTYELIFFYRKQLRYEMIFEMIRSLMRLARGLMLTLRWATAES
ncbi:MAG TPA: hypothetical protein VMH84_11425 [Xanthobacteraceae bacterium]|nr:hypothetical protein [Xanthobacteraceae bacterium]